MYNQAGFFDLFKTKKQPLLNFITQNIDPQIEELRSVINELKNLSRSSNEASQLFYNMKEIFFQIQSLKQTILRNTKTAQVSGMNPVSHSFYMDKLSDLIKNLMGNLNQLSSMTDNDEIKKQVYNNYKLMRENVYMLDNYEKEQQEDEVQEQSISQPTQEEEKSVNLNELPNFFQRFVKTLQGYEQQGAMVDVEAIRGMLSTWVRNYGLSLLDKNLGEYKGRYIPVETFMKLINNEQVDRTDKRKLVDRRIDPTG